MFLPQIALFLKDRKYLVKSKGSAKKNIFKFQVQSLIYQVCGLLVAKV